MKKIVLVFFILRIEHGVLSSPNTNTTSSRSSACGEVFLEKEFILQSPGYPNVYPSNFDCRFLLKSPNCPTRYIFEFLDFNLEKSLGCTKDRLEIGKQDALCGNRTSTKTYSTENGMLQLNFKTDSSGSGKGFKILIRRMDCEESGETTTEIQYEWATTKPTIKPRTFKGSQCCLSSYNSRNFFLVSPNFPLSVSKPLECSYKIRKATSNVCRLRLHFHFFFLGAPTYNSCPYGYLEIDGKHVCGCNDNLKIITTFDGGYEKVLKFKSEGGSINSYSGFVLEVIQDECPKRYVPQDSESVVVESADSFKSSNEQKNGRIRRNDELFQKLNLFGEQSENLDNIIKHFYFFSASDEENTFSTPKEKEETTYIETSEINSVKTNIREYRKCLDWNQLQFNTLTARFGSSLGMCRRDDVEVAQSSSNNCVELNQIRGFFKSPGYPFYYPGNTNMCYRFSRRSGYCSIKVTFADFLLEKSENCRNDYILLANRNKYCGRSLAGKTSTFDVRNRPYEEMRFVTDSFYCGRGFKGFYVQIPCQQDRPMIPAVPEYPEVPTEPNIPVRPDTPPPEYKSNDSAPCGGTFYERHFILEAKAINTECRFKIEKSSEDVCKIRLIFEKVDLICTVESIVVGDTMYCGNLSGKIVTIDANKNKTIVYKNMGGDSVLGTRLRIAGYQNNDCSKIPRPPAQRLLELTPPNTSAPLLFNRHVGMRKKDASDLFRETSNEHLRDVCALLENASDDDLPDVVCNIMKQFYNTTQCSHQHVNTTSIHTGKATNTLQKTYQLGEILGEIDCDKYYKVGS